MRTLVVVLEATSRRFVGQPWPPGTGENRAQGDSHMRDLKPEEIGHVYGAGGYGHHGHHRRNKHDTHKGKHSSGHKKHTSHKRHSGHSGKKSNHCKYG